MSAPKDRSSKNVYILCKLYIIYISFGPYKYYIFSPYDVPDTFIGNKKITMQRGGGRGYQGEMGKSCQGTCIKNSWTKPQAGRIEGGGKMETTVLEQQ